MGETAPFKISAFQIYISRFICVVLLVYNFASMLVLEKNFGGKQWTVLTPGYTLFVTLRKLAYFSRSTFLWPKTEVNYNFFCKFLTTASQHEFL